MKVRYLGLGVINSTIYLVKLARDLTRPIWPPNDGLVREITLFQGNRGWWCLVKYYSLARFISFVCWVGDFYFLARDSSLIKPPLPMCFCLQIQDIDCFIPLKILRINISTVSNLTDVSWELPQLPGMFFVFSRFSEMNNLIRLHKICQLILKSF